MMKRCVDFLVATGWLLATLSATAAEISYSTVDGFERVPLVVAESGNPQGPAILFIHGFSQGLLSWKYQLGDVELQRKFRMVALDLRGHGASGKPWQPETYDKKAYAHDIDAVLKAKNLADPVIVAWSFGGEITMTYLREHGTGGLGALILVAAPASLDGPRKLPPSTDPVFSKLWQTLKQMQSLDTAVNLAASEQFVIKLFSKPMSPEDVHETLALNMMTPAYVRAASSNYIPDNSDLAGNVNVRTLVIHGNMDSFVPVEISFSNQRNIKRSTLLIYEGIGHAPFIEDSRRFNRDLAKFIDARPSKNGTSADK